MAKIKQKTKRCEILIDNILRSIYKNALNNTSTNVVDEAEIIHDNDTAGYVTYAVNTNVLAPGRNWSYDFPPEADEVEITLVSAICDMFYGGSGKRLRNLTKYINEQLMDYEGKILEY